MTSHYAKVHDATIREAFDRYQAQRINIFLTGPFAPPGSGDCPGPR